jgi:hypothetical protein
VRIRCELAALNRFDANALEVGGQLMTVNGGQLTSESFLPNSVRHFGEQKIGSYKLMTGIEEPKSRLGAVLRDKPLDHDAGVDDNDAISGRDLRR